jgi:hypothetical protein
VKELCPWLIDARIANSQHILMPDSVIVAALGWVEASRGTIPVIQFLHL